MVASTDIKFYVHTNNSAPQLQNTYGSMINVLDACLINGINIGTVSSLTASGTTATVLFSTSHNLMQYQVIKITGTNQAEFNGEHRILTVPNAQSFTFELVATPSTTTATGTITASLPPLDWEKPLSSTNVSGGGKAAYRSKNLLLPSRPFLRVVDELDPAYTATYAKYAKVGIVEDMTDITTMLGAQAPFDTGNPNKNWIGTGSGNSAINGWAKWYYAIQTEANVPNNDTNAPVSGNRGWVLVGNSDYFYILPTVNPNNPIAFTYGFGSFESLLNIDSANTFLAATNLYYSASVSWYKAKYTGLANNDIEAKVWLQRGYSQNLMPAHGYCCSLGVSSAMYSGSTDYVGGYSLVNMSIFAPVFINESVLRGEVPGFYWLLQNKPYANYSLIEKNNSLYIAVLAATHAGNSTTGQVVLKIGEL